MRHEVLVSVGVMGHVYRVACPEAVSPGTSVIVRTGYGVQSAMVTARVARAARGGDGGTQAIGDSRGESSDGFAGVGIATADWVRSVTSQDTLLDRRLRRDRPAAMEAARRILVESGSAAILLDADLTHDGGTLLLHFLGPHDAAAESATARLADVFAATTGTERLVRLLSDGCGPGCGTDTGGGESAAGASGCGGCAGCSVKAACGQPRSS